MKNKIITFGEIMLRLSPENNERFTQCHEFEAVYGGGEANTAVSLANFGVDCGFVTKLPEHSIGQSAVNSLRQYGVDISNIVRGGDQIGIYFLEKKTSQRPTNVIYNRAGSAFALATADDFNWDCTWPMRTILRSSPEPAPQPVSIMLLVSAAAPISDRNVLLFMNGILSFRVFL